MTAAPGSPNAPATGLDAAAMAAVLLKLYDAALQPEPWPRILAALAPLMGTTKALFIRVDRTHPRDSILDVIGLESHFVERLHTRDLTQDYIWQTVLRRPAGQVFRTTELLPLDVLHTGPMYEQIGRPAGIDYVLGANIENSPQFFATVSFVQASTDFDDARKDLLALLLPHLQTVHQVILRIAAADAGRREALHSFDRSRQALVVLDRSGYAIYRNATAERTLARVPGMQIKLGRFLFDDVLTQVEFEQAVRSAVTSAAGDDLRVPQRLRVTPRDGRSPLVLSVIPLTNWSDRVLLPVGAGCMVLIFDEGSSPPLPVARLAWLYQLTPAEARTCDALYHGGSIEAAAGLLTLSPHTVRSHLKNVYAKFGVASLPQLMQRLATAASNAGDDARVARD